MQKLLALLLIALVALPAAGRAQPGPGASQNAPPGPASLKAAGAGPDLLEPAAPPGPPPALLARPLALSEAALAQTSTCRQVLSDPGVDVLKTAGTPWGSFRSRIIFDSSKDHTGTSGSLSLSMQAGDDTSPGSGPDRDAVGQPNRDLAGSPKLVIPANLTEMTGGLWYYYEPGSGNPTGDQLRVELYEPGGYVFGDLITQARVITTTGLISNTWTFVEWEVFDPETVATLRQAGEVDLVFSLAAGTTESTAKLWLDDLEAYTCVPIANLGGRVRQGGAAVPGARVLLARTGKDGATSVVSTARTAADGTYRFVGAPALADGERYRVWFLNQPETLPRQAGLVGLWAGPLVSALGAGQDLTGQNFDVADVQLQSPASYAEVVATDAAPAVLRWGGRANAGERHRVCIYDPERADAATGLPVQVCGPLLDPSSDELAFKLGPGSFAGSPGFSFTYGRSYRWYVVVYDRDPGDPAAQYGYSFGERAITLLSAPMPAPPTAPAPDPSDPAAGAPGADWTLMIYMAADNAIGDPRRAPNLGRPAGQLASLPALAAAHQGVNLLSYVDRYGPDGVELCAYTSAGAADCRARAEANSADPATLGGFVEYGLRRYPATRTALLIVAPGQAAGQLALDETAPGAPAMSLAGLQTAFQAAGLGGTAKLDLVIYQAPLLGSVEALLATEPYARYMVASPGQIWQLGPYRSLVPLLAGAQKGDPAAVARGAARAYADTTASVGGVRAVSWAAYDLSRAAGLGQAVDVLAGAIEIGITSDAGATRPAVALARAAAQVYDSSGNGLHDALETGGKPAAVEEDLSLDLWNLAGKLEIAVGAEANVQIAATDVLALLEDQATTPVIAAEIRSGQSAAISQIDLSNARGLAIFFPSGARLGGEVALAESYLFSSFSAPPGSSAWASMLRTYGAAVPGPGPGGATEGAGGGVQFRPLPGGFVSTTMYLPNVWR